MIDKYRKTLNNEVEKSSFWPLFTDMLSTVVMVVLLLLFSVSKASESIDLEIVKGIEDSMTEIFNDANVEVDVDVDNITGKITLGSNMMFDTDKYELKEEAKEMLKIIIPDYVNTLYSKYGDYIGKVLVEGHTDDVGEYLYNLELSQKRAYSVVEYILSDEIGDYEYKDELREDIIAIGRSKAELIYYDNGEVDRDSSRRVELSYELDINENK